MNILKRFFPFLIVLVLAFFTFKPLLTSGFFPIHDDTQVARVFEMTKALQDGMFPVRWSQDLGYGYGYPIFNYYNPFPYYVGGIIGVIGVDSLLATRLVIIFGILLSGISMYLLAKEFWGKLGGLLSSLLFLYAPYHAVDTYVRGDVAELYAYAFIPLLFYGIWKTYKEQKWRNVVITSLAFGGIITSHNLTAMMVTPFVVLFILYLLIKQKKLNLYLFYGFILGIVVSAFYWIPAIFEMNYTNVLSQVGGGADFRDHFVCINQLWTSTWGYGGSVKGCVDGISFMIGKYHILLTLVVTLISITVLYWKKYAASFTKEKEKLFVILLSFIGFVISIFFALDLSKPIWELIKPMSFFQYPWRFLIMITFFSSFISGALYWYLDKYTGEQKMNYIPAVLVFGFLILVSVKFFTPQTSLNLKSEDYTNKNTINWVTSRISDEYMPKNFQRPKDQEAIANFSKLNSNELKINSISQKTQEISLNVSVSKKTSIVLPLAYFPAWRGSINGKDVNLYESRRGTLVDLPQGNYTLKLAFHQTFIEIIANLVSLVGIFALFAGIILLRSKKA